MANKYSREAAVDYALKYGLTPNPQYKYFGIHGELGGDCTNFVSQCLNEGGAEMVYDKKLGWWYLSGKTIDNTSQTWSLSWATANSLYWFIKKRGQMNVYGLKGEEIGDINALELGDLIFYENFKGVINHSSIITGFYEGLPLITQHSVEAVNISHIKKNKSKMHFVKLTF
jgi:hypothetical protein